jgi:hypothetical protein
MKKNNKQEFESALRNAFECAGKAEAIMFDADFDYEGWRQCAGCCDEISRFIQHIRLRCERAMGIITSTSPHYVLLATQTGTGQEEGF